MEAATPEVPELLEGQVQQLVSDVGELRQEVKSLRAWQLRVSSLEQAIEKAVVTTMPKLDLLLARVNVTDVDGATALALATAAGQTDMVAFLLSKGATPTTCNKKDEAPVLLAAAGGHADIVGLLLKNGAFVDASDKEGRTPLTVAAKAGHWHIVERLLQSNACATTCKEPQLSALALAAREGNVAMVRDLLRRGAKADLAQVEEALKKAKNAAVVWALLEVTEEAENTYFANVALLWAAHEGRYEALQSLLESGVDVNKDTDEDGASALYYAAQSGHTACVAELLRRGADANLKCKKGESPLHRSSAYGHVECVRVLLAAGADKAAKNDNNKTALDIAGSETVRALLRTES
ncbi:Ankyrin repeat and KH domain-containing protein mask [Gryllus bimaculatus]|nr:Ankyrin repeat and KH domain-containing protein mask [Gryllus bimaculatus]